jgi:hypothetical protein
MSDFLVGRIFDNFSIHHRSGENHWMRLGVKRKRERENENTQLFGRIGQWVLCKIRKHGEGRVSCNEKLVSLYRGSKKNITEKIIASKSVSTETTLSIFPLVSFLFV